MRNKLQCLMLISAFLMSFSTLGIAEPSKPSPPHGDNGAIQNQDEETAIQTEQWQEQVAPAQGTQQIVGQAANKAGQMQDQMYQAQGTKDQTAAQVEGSTQQAMQQGVSQTQQVAEQLRQNKSSVAQDMQSTVSSTKVG